MDNAMADMDAEEDDARVRSPTIKMNRTPYKEAKTLVHVEEARIARLSPSKEQQRGRHF